MTNLSRRVQKSKQLKFREIGGSNKRMLATVGSKQDRYQITFSYHLENMKFGDQLMGIRVFEVDCQRIDTGNGKLNPMEACKGNCQHTVCYHCLGGLRHLFQEQKKTISFHNDIFSVITAVNIGGTIAKVETLNGGWVWAVIREATIKVENKPVVNLMRGDSDDEGID